MGVSSLRISAALRSGAEKSLECVRAATGAGLGCGACQPEIEELVADLAGRAVSPDERERNRRVCRVETRARVERALLGIGRELPPGSAAELLSASGLRVELRITGELAHVRRVALKRLRRGVCRDVEVHFEAALDVPRQRRFR
jgi:bacterioferritin-associated ferredoxin